MKMGAIAVVLSALTVLLAAGGAAAAECITAGPFIRYQDTKDGVWTATMLIAAPRVSRRPVLTLKNGVNLTTVPSQNIFQQKLGSTPIFFWRFNLAVPVMAAAQSISYSFGNLSTCGRVTTADQKFSVAGEADELHFAFYSDMDEPTPEAASGAMANWGKMLAVHKTKPYQLLVGLGGMVNNEDVLALRPIRSIWARAANRATAWTSAKWTPTMQAAVEAFYFKNYIEILAMGNTRMGRILASVPTASMYDDTDIFPNVFSHDAAIVASPVYKALVSQGMKYYSLFMLHIAPGQKTAETFIAPGMTTLKYVGPTSQLLSLDTRAQRTTDQVMSNTTYPAIISTLSSATDIKFLYVATGNSILSWAWPSAATLSNATLYPTLVDPLSEISPFGDSALLTEVAESWGSKALKAERDSFVVSLQTYAATMMTRVTFLGGNMHLIGAGTFEDINLSGDIMPENDPKSMSGFISSPIGDIPMDTVLCSVYNTISEQSDFLGVNSTTTVYLSETFADDSGDSSVPLYPTLCGDDGLRLMPFRNFGDVSFSVDDDSALVRMYYVMAGKVSKIDTLVPTLTPAA